MPASAEAPPPVRTRALRAFVLGGLAVGVLDLLDAFVFFGLRGIAPLRIAQSIASGLLGRASYQGGPATAALGVALHFCIAFTVVGVYALASRRLAFLSRQPLVWGSVYGLAVYAVMNLVVIPLSAIGPRPAPAPPVLVNGLLIHVLGVGLPSALSARWARRG